MAETFEAWWATIGIVTKVLMIISIFTTASFSFGFISPYSFTIDWSSFVWNLQLWRPITSMLFLGKFGFPWLINIAMMVMYLRKHEDEDFQGRTADLVWMIFILCASLHFVAFFLGLPLVSHAFSMSLVWIFCKRHEDAQLKIMSFAVRASLFPWAMTAFHLILGQDWFSDVVGIVGGHVYFFLADILPKTHNITLIRTPALLYQWFPKKQLTAFSVHAPPIHRAFAENGAGPHTWGTGRTLGGGQ